jgi:hypothetical protein
MKIINETSFNVEALPGSGPGGKTVLTIIVKGTFDIAPNEMAAVSREQIPVAFGDEFNDEKQGGSVKFEADVAPFKPRADIVLVGKGHATGGKLIQVLDVLLRVGEKKKIIRVFGDRHWDCSSSLFPERASVPQPFRTMDLTCEKAFGGIDKEGGDYCRENPVGRGFISGRAKKVPDGAPLPNLEDPDSLIKTWKDHPRPVGFGFYGRAWMPRVSYLGTYDEKWRRERSPGPPEDFRFDYYNGAYPDLQVDGYLKGIEEVELANLSPEGTLLFQLPGIQPACVVTRFLDLLGGENGGVEHEEVPLNLDTLCLIPEEKRLFQVWRGLCPIRDFRALEINAIKIQ